MKPIFHVTYDSVTEESAENGDIESSGFCSPHGWKHDDPADLSLREVLSIVGRGSCYDGGRSFYTADADTNYRTGEDTTYAVHPPRTITSASYARLRRILTGS
jgi:hypothetical protein